MEVCGMFRLITLRKETALFVDPDEKVLQTLKESVLNVGER